MKIITVAKNLTQTNFHTILKTIVTIFKFFYVAISSNFMMKGVISYTASFHIQYECEKMRTRTIPDTDIFTQ